jgi:hypothetical protein
VTEPAPGATSAGENEQANVDGRPEQERKTGLLNVPDCGFTITVTLPFFPAGIVMVDGVALTEKIN